MIEVPNNHYHRGSALIAKLLMAVVAGLLSACVATNTPAPSTEPLTPQQQDILLDLEYAAVEALRRGHFSLPVANSAENLYQQMLAIDPSNETAKRGIEQILEQHIAEALDALASQHVAAANTALAQARRLDPSHPSIAPTETQLQLLANAEFVRIELPEGDVRQRSDQTYRRLRDLLSQVDANQNCRFTIAVASDAQGRYVYQLLKQGMNEFLTQSRLRAAIVISSPNRVEGTCY